MAKGIYQRYECAETPYTEYEKQQIGTLGTSSIRKGVLFRTLSIDKTTGIITLYYAFDSREETYKDQTAYAFADTGKLIVNAYNLNASTNLYVSVVYTYALQFIAQPVTKYSYSRGTYLADIIADYGSLPTNGRHTDGYWYVFVKMASDLKVNVGGIWRDSPTGWVNVGGIMRPQSELKANVNGIYR